MKISQETARRALATIQLCGTVEAAAGDCRMQLRAIAPYSDRKLSAVLQLLDYLAGKAEERKAILLTQLHTLA